MYNLVCLYAYSVSIGVYFVGQGVVWKGRERDETTGTGWGQIVKVLNTC